MSIKEKIYRISELTLGVRSKEFYLVQLFFLYILLICTGYTLTSTAAITLFLSKLSEKSLHALLPWLYISNAITIALVAAWYGKLIDKISRLKLITFTTTFFILSFLLLRILIAILGNQSWVYFFFMVWDETCSVVLIMVFYSYLGDYFHVENAKRLFGYISGGMALGAPIGGFGSAFLLHHLRPANLLFISMGLLALSNLVAFMIWRTGAAPKRTSHSIEHPKPLQLKTLLAHPYLKAIFICCVAASICTAIEVYQLFFIASQALPNEQAVGSFMGKLFGYIGITQLIINFVLARWLFEYLGILNVMLILPILFVLLGFGFTVYPILLFAAGIKFIDAGLSGTLGNMVTQILLLPLPERIRIHSQAILTGLMGTTARIIGGIILILFSLSTLPIRYYSIIIIFAAIFWLFNVIKLISLYKKEAYKNWS